MILLLTFSFLCFTGDLFADKNRFELDTRIVGGETVEKREDFPYQVENIYYIQKQKQKLATYLGLYPFL